MPHKKKYIDWDDIDDLGEVPDAVIAKRLRVSAQAVQSARSRRGIAPKGTAGRPRLNKKQKAEREKARIARFRKMVRKYGWDFSLTDAQMADTYVVDGKRHTPSFYNKIRVALGIKSATKLRGN